MPTYEYVCKTCGKIFEYFQSIQAPPLRHCVPEYCDEAEKGKGIVERRISGGVGLIFKGDGFYITDYKRGKKQETTDSSSSDKQPTNAEKSETKASVKE